MEDFARLSTITGAQKLKDLPTRDWMGQGLSKQQAEDLFRAGLGDPNDVTERPDEPDKKGDDKPGKKGASLTRKKRLP